MTTASAGGRRARVMAVGGAAVVLVGLLVIMAGWWGASGTARVTAQIPYLLSGGFAGLGLLTVGVVLAARGSPERFVRYWMVRRLYEQRVNGDRLVSAMANLEDLMMEAIEGARGSDDHGEEAGPDPSSWSFLAAHRAATHELTAEGRDFEVIEDLVRGERMTVFRQRHKNLGELLASARRYGDTDFLIFDGGPRITYAEHDRMVASTAAALHDRFGVCKGDRVAIASANVAGWVLAAHACFKLGAVLVALNSWWSADELGSAVRLAEPVLVLADEARRRRLEGQLEVSVFAIERVVDELARADVDPAYVPVEVDEDDPAALLYTSGTSGAPKAATITHRSLVGFVQLTNFIGARAFMLSGQTAPPTTSLVRLSVFPLFHISGLGSLLSSLVSGHTTVWPTGRFDPARVIELTRTEGINHWSGASTHLIRLLDDPAIVDLDAGRMMAVGIGGSASTPSLINRTEARFPHLRRTLSSGYGMTECGGLATFAPNGMLAASADCVGDPLPTVDVRVVDDDGRPLPDGEVGTISIRGPITMLGYWQNPDANSTALSAGGWLRTEDFGRLVDGILFLNSRRRDLIIRGGENVYPIEIEDCLDQHPDVIESACFGRPHDELGQEVHALVVVRPDASATPEALRAHCETKLAYYKVPTRITVTTTPLPRNAAGKILKQVIERDEIPACQGSDEG